MNKNLSIYELLFIIIIGSIVSKINNWDIFYVVAIYILCFNLINFIFFDNINNVLIY